MEGARSVVSDDHRGLVQTIARYFRGLVWQRCQVHSVRNVLNAVSLKDRREVLELLKVITEARSLGRARRAVEEVTSELGPKYPRVAKWREEQGKEILAVYQLPAGHRRRRRSTNLLERLSQERKRRTMVAPIFPHEAACQQLVCALAMQPNAEWMERIYLNMDVTPTRGYCKTLRKTIMKQAI